MPNQKCNPTDEQRAHVRMLAANGVSLIEIGKIVNLSPKTLRRYFRQELIKGRMAGRATIFAAQYKMALSGKHPYATISFLRRNAHWHEGMEVDRFAGSGIHREVYIAEIRTLKSSRPPDRRLEEFDQPAEVFHDPWGGAADPDDGD